jgi:deoxyribodipyrimidine photo-lyase
MNIFISKKLKLYEKHKNDPSLNGQSQLSPYIHFGQLSTQRIALSISSMDPDEKYSTSFLEELIVRKELSENFCWYNKSYDSTDSFPSWAKKTLADHENDIRPYIYSLEEFELANTHDSLWNAAQKELILTGKMHGYMRMYWAKKILEWTHTSEEALRICIHLNDLYSLDGRDPNGYAGIAWSIGGVHDRPWFTRPIFGMVRYMNDTSLLKKYDCSDYISTYSNT